MRFVLMIAAFFLVLSSCKTHKPVIEQPVNPPVIMGGSEELYMYQWNLAELNGKTVDASSGAKLFFAPGRISGVTGSTGCNSLKGTMELGADHGIKFSPLAVTQKACIGNNVEQEFLKSLEQTKVWSISNQQLQLIDGSKVVAKLNGVKPSAGISAALQGTWELEYIAVPKVEYDWLYPDKRPTIIIKETGEFSGSTSCNGMGGKLHVVDAELKFDAPVTTMMACPGIGEQVFLKTLKDIDSYEIKDGKLLLKGEGIEIMRLKRI